MWSKVSEQVDVSLDEAESRGACLESYSEAAHKDLRLREKNGQLVCPARGIYARAAYWAALDPIQKALHKMRALARLHPEWVFCGASAATVYGLPVSYALLDELSIASSSGGKKYCAGKVRGVYIADEEADGVCLDGVCVTSPLRTALDCARLLSFRDATAVLDAALAKRLFAKEELIAYVDGRKSGIHGIARAREAARFADARSGSGGESIARAAMYELGFVAPELQVCFADPIDGRSYFVDFLWRLPNGRTVAGELDGGEKYANAAMTGGKSALQVMRAERKRESRITASCDAVVRFSPSDVANARRFNELLCAFGIPKDHEPLIAIAPRSTPEPPPTEQVPLECYGL